MKAEFPGFFYQLWKNPNATPKQNTIKRGKSGKSHKRQQSGPNPTTSYLAAWHCMDDIWDKMKKEEEMSGLSGRSKCFLLDCYYLWTKGTREEQVWIWDR